MRCTSFYCSYTDQSSFTDPITPALAIPKEGPQAEPVPSDKTGAEAADSLYAAMGKSNDGSPPVQELDISDERIPIPQLCVKDLPHCPKCKSGLLRPGVVWFGEMLPGDILSAIDDFIAKSEKIDLILVVGTSAKVYPAAGYVDLARAKGARVAVINMDRADTPGGRNGLTKDDWFFEGDAGVIVPEILKPVVGDI